MCLFQIDHFADKRHEQRLARFLGGLFCVFERLVIRMLAQAELGMVNRDVAGGIQVFHLLAQILRHRVDLRPVRIVLPVFENPQVDVRELLPDLCVMLAIAAVTANPYSPLGRLKHE